MNQITLGYNVKTNLKNWNFVFFPAPMRDYEAHSRENCLVGL